MGTLLMCLALQDAIQSVEEAVRITRGLDSYETTVESTYSPPSGNSLEQKARSAWFKGGPCICITR